VNPTYEYCQWNLENKENMILFLESCKQPYLINRHHLFLRFAESYDRVQTNDYVVKKDGVILRNTVQKPEN
jgi:hypothetical protein